MRRPFTVPLIFALAACATPPKAASERAAPPTTPKPAVLAPASSKETPRARALALFERLVAMVRRNHVFAPQTARNLGKSWDADLPRLRAEFAATNDDDALSVALFHFGNSLHDAHCQFRPTERGARLRLPLRVGVEKVSNDGYQFYVERVNDDALKAQLAVGDILEEVDGVAANGLLAEHDWVSNMNAKENIALDVATYLTSRRTSTTRARAGTTSEWKVRPRGGGPSKSTTMTWKQSSGGDDGDDFALDYDLKDCVNGDPIDYGPYTLSARGYRLCIYTSTATTYRDYPIVRQVSFRYDELQHGALADYGLVRRTLASASPKGVIVDVQDNRGGNNPNLFVDWWSDKPYTDNETHVLLEPKLFADGGDVHVSSVSATIAKWYEGELNAGGHLGAGGQRFSRPRPLICRPDTCEWDNRYVPTHRVTRAPVALLVGPGCISSCDTLALRFDREDLGPILGRRPMAGFTTHRARFEVASRDGAPPIGTIEVAVSYDTTPGVTESIEGTPAKLDVPVERTFENHDRYQRVLVDAAIAALKQTKR